jgi:uncharacterized protein YaeQ
MTPASYVGKAAELAIERAPDPWRSNPPSSRRTLAVADIDHGYYADHALTLARHPSETDERMMVRLARWPARARSCRRVQRRRHAGLRRRLVERGRARRVAARLHRPDALWIEVGQPDDKPIAKACRKADQVALYASTMPPRSGGAASRTSSRGRRTCQVWRMPTEASQELAALAQRSMQLQATIQEGTLMLGDGTAASISSLALEVA